MIGDGLIGLVGVLNTASAAPAISYLLKDHLGSLDVIVGDYGNVVQALSFDAWGLRRDTASWVNLDPIPMVFFNTSITRKGFTGHEMLDDVGIIDMGGRIYDPRLGRFLQADPFIQAPMNSQSHNRYSYVLNNPLVNVDPSGFFLKKLFSKLGRFPKKVWKNPYVRMAVSIVAAIYTFNAALFAENIIANAAAAGFVSGGIMTGSLKGAVMGALTGAVTGAIGDLGLGDFTHFAQGLGGGVMSDLQGGKFGHGFVSAGVGSLMGGGQGIKDDFARYATVALVGGTVSKMTGGKFANGAATAALSSIVREGVNIWRGPRLGGEVSVDTGQIETPADQGMVMRHLRTLVDDPDVNQESLYQAGLDALAVGTGVTFSRSEARVAATIQNTRSHQRTVAQGLGAVMAAPVIVTACAAAPSVCYSAAEGMLGGSAVRLVTGQSVNVGTLAVDATIGVVVGVPFSAAGAASGPVGEWIWRFNSQTLTIPMNLPPP